MLSRARCDTVCRKGNVGVVNGVVMPAISIQIRPYPELRIVLPVSRKTAPNRGPKLFFFNGRTGSAPGYSSAFVCRLNTAVCPLISVDGKFRVYRRPGFTVSRSETFQSF